MPQFEDAEAGGFFFTAADHEQLIHRSKTFSDDSLPSGNGVAAAVLCRLGLLLGELRYLDAAERTLQAGWPMLQQYPQAHMSLLNALEDFLTPMQILIIRGDAAEAERWSTQIGALYAPAPDDIRHSPRHAELPPALAAKSAVSGTGTVAYVCTRYDVLRAARRFDVGGARTRPAHPLDQGNHLQFARSTSLKPRLKPPCSASENAGAAFQSNAQGCAVRVASGSVAWRGNTCACRAGSTLPNMA